MRNKKIFVWKEVSQWSDTLAATIVPPSNREKMVHAIEHNSARFIYTDDVVCFRDVYSELGDYDRLQRDLVAQLRSAFPLIRMFHCCRPVNVQSYYDNGLLVLDSNKANERFRTALIDSPEFPEITATHIEAAIKEMAGGRGRHGYIYFGLDDRASDRQLWALPHLWE